MKYLSRSRNFWIVISADLVSLTLAYLLSFVIRFETLGLTRPPVVHWIPSTLPFVLVCKLLVFYFFGLYRGIWRYTGIRDLVNIIKATVLASLLIVATFFYLFRFAPFPRSVLAIDWLLTLVFISGFRLLIRLYLSPSFSLLNGKPFLRASSQSSAPVNLLIVGAGDAGEKILREILQNPRLPYQVVGFLDDNLKKRGLQIHGIPILGKTDELPWVVRQRRIQEILIAIPSASGTQMRRIVTLCKDARVRFKTIPGLGDLINGKASIKEIRDVSYEDLLGREAVELDEEVISSCLSGKRILVTGAGGSIGSELCRQVARFSPELLICYERTENALFHLEMKVLREMQDLSYRSFIGDTLDESRLSEVFKKTAPQVVFHAAAYKHVPLMELNAVEAIKNNIFSTRNLAVMADRSGVERFVQVSTDKAVDPINIMGATKRAAELVIQSFPRIGSGTYVTVRFGNVIGSEGSVVPLFQAQIARGGPVTVTHPEATRFFMSIPEAAQLILEAGSIGKGGEIFLLEMGSPVRILELAEDLIRLSGKEPYTDIEIVFTGLRPGEKLHEQLSARDENTLPTPHPKIRVLKPFSVNRTAIFQKIEDLHHLIVSANGKPISPALLRQHLGKIVPEYRPDRKSWPKSESAKIKTLPQSIGEGTRHPRGPKGAEE
ncbi:MAG: nucleoside-diphosphate sugar epimerase/dehydratase [candidate division NC10 bacterium]|nr:nucleoside-diphosphate sugar epimerase/dehydratase [candidate division NC10 bacterium]